MRLRGPTPSQGSGSAHRPATGSRSRGRRHRGAGAQRRDLRGDLRPTSPFPLCSPPSAPCRIATTGRPSPPGDGESGGLRGRKRSRPERLSPGERPGGRAGSPRRRPHRTGSPGPQAEHSPDRRTHPGIARMRQGSHRSSRSWGGSSPEVECPADVVGGGRRRLVEIGKGPGDAKGPVVTAHGDGSAFEGAVEWGEGASVYAERTGAEPRSLRRRRCVTRRSRSAGTLPQHGPPPREHGGRRSTDRAVRRHSRAGAHPSPDGRR